MEKTKKILVVEDGEKNMAVAKRYFGTRKDLQIEMAIDHDQAIAKLKEGKFDGVISDIFMPQKTGSNEKLLGIALYKKIYEKAYKLFKAQFEAKDQEVGYTDRILDCCYKLIAAISKDASNQPLGLLIGEKAKELGTPCVLVTSLFHHNHLAEPVFAYNWEFSDLKLPIHEGGIHEEGKGENEKLKAEFWKGACLKLEEKMK